MHEINIKTVRNPDDPERCVVNIFKICFSFTPSKDGSFNFFSLPSDAISTLKFSKEYTWNNTLAKH